uniref:ZAD domain-containing protein n=1 Tax=Anopheles stephensi TaxID=30069 RepID=A0A182YP27_ANOST
MERFSISILRQQVYNICRLCGVDNPDKTLILGDEDVICIMESDEPSLAKKIEECVGIQVHVNDQMPQNICSLCVDKVNDFYEYRLMCASTNIQTRTFLNLPLVQPSISLLKSEPESTVEELLDDKSLATVSTQKHSPKTRNRKKQLGTEEPDNSGEDTDLKSFPDVPSAEKRVKYEHACQYCNEKYDQPTDLERHLVVKHTPLVHKFGCGSCMEYFDTASEYKDHNLWHKLTRTAFGCFRHVALKACIKRPPVTAEVKLVPDMRCALCQKVFKTRNLYEWHACFIRARANCPKCGKYFLKKNLLTRHFMLYCTGTLPLMEPDYMLINEAGIGPANGLPPNDSLAPGGGTVVPKRRRGRPARSTEPMKEETLDLPFPPLLDLPDVKSENNSVADGQLSSEETGSNEELNEAQRRASLVEETDKITTLLRSGASVDGNTDIATISSMLSSVNEAIATISKVRKMKKKRDRGHVSGEGGERRNPPMVVLSMANVKQEAHDDPNGFVTLTNSAGVGKELNATAPMDDSHQTLSAAGGESDHDSGASEAGDNVGDSFADRNDSDGESSDVEIISVDTYRATGPSSNAAANEPEEATGTLQQMVPIKQEPMATNDGDESDFEGYEDASTFVAVKQEPSDPEPVATEPHHAEPSVSSYQALRIKIKKEKGLLNASVIEAGEPVDPIGTSEVNGQKAPKAHSKRSARPAGASGTKATKPAAKQNDLPPPAKRPRSTSAELLMVPIKQEPLESNEQQQQQESVTTEQYCTTDTTFFDSSMVRVKQEPLDDSSRPQCSSGASPLPATESEPPASPTDIVAFDGTRIKQERADKEPVAPKAKKALNPLSLTGVRLAGSKKSANSNLPSQPTTAQKSSVMINPFALLKQKESLSTDDGQASGTRENDTSVQLGLPVISQVKSIDPVEHSSFTAEATVEAGPSSLEVEHPPADATAELEHCDDTANPPNADSSPPTELSCDGSEPTASSVSPKESVSELKIASVTTISEDAYGGSNEEPLSTAPDMPTEATDNDDDEGALATVSEPHRVNDEAASDTAGIPCRELAEKDLLPTLDFPDDGMRQVEEEPEPDTSEEERGQMDSAEASEPAEETVVEDNAVVSKADEQQECDDIVAAEESIPSIDKTAVSNTAEMPTTAAADEPDQQQRKITQNHWIRAPLLGMMKF